MIHSPRPLNNLTVALVFIIIRTRTAGCRFNYPASTAGT